jgi:hypothetical protein
MKERAGGRYIGTYKTFLYIHTVQYYENQAMRCKSRTSPTNVCCVPVTVRLITAQRRPQPLAATAPPLDVQLAAAPLDIQLTAAPLCPPPPDAPEAIGSGCAILTSFISRTTSSMSMMSSSLSMRSLGGRLGPLHVSRPHRHTVACGEKNWIIAFEALSHMDELSTKIPMHFTKNQSQKGLQKRYMYRCTFNRFGKITP